MMPSSLCTSIGVAMRNRIYAEQKASILPMPPPGAPLPAYASAEHALVYGSAATVAEKLAPLKATGVGGLIMQFWLGPMNLEQTAASLRLFADKVIPALWLGTRALHTGGVTSGVCVFGSFTTIIGMTILLPFLPLYVEQLARISHTML
jgi:hypothetical protein